MRVRRGAVAVLVSVLALAAGCRGGPTGEPGRPGAGEGPAEVARGEVGAPLEEGYQSPRGGGSPFALTASDGTGLRLASVRARAVVDDPLALTELRLTFDNPEDRTLEGTFRITLPPGAAVSRFAMRVGDRWQEGEVVEKQAARRAYEDFLHRKQDPALLEQAAGNEFSARVFPIPARGRKELILSYSQELRGGEPYALPLRGLPEVEELDLAAYVPGRAEPAHALRRARSVPAGDFGFRRGGDRPAMALRNGELALVRFRPAAEAQPEPLSSLLVLFDTSASRALGFDAQVDALRRLAAEVAAKEGPETPLTVVCFDQSSEVAFEGKAGGFGDEAVAKIRERGAFGASDLEAALGAAAARAKAGGLRRVLLVSDGVPTAGDVAGDKVWAAARALRDAGVERLDALAVGGIRDESMLARVARSGLARDGVVAEGSAEAAELGRKLRASTRSLELRIEGASWQYPRAVSGVQPGDEVLVYAELGAGEPVRLSAGGEPVRVPELRTSERALLERGWAQAKIASLLEEHKKEGVQEAIVKQVVDLSVKHRVLSPYTSLLVLETEQDYARFHIERRALADILTVEDGRIAVARRSFSDSFGPKKAPEKAEKKDAEDEGGGWLGLRKRKAGAASESAAATEGAPLDLPRAAAAAPAASAAPATPGGPGGPAQGRVERLADARERDGDGLGLSNTTPDRGGRADAPAEAPPPPPPPPPPPAAMATAPAPRAAARAARPAFDTVDPWASTEGRAAGGGGAAAARRRPPPGSPAPTLLPPKQTPVEPFTGKFKEVMDLVAAQRAKQAVALAYAWRKQSPGDVLALVALGAAYEAAGELESAARAYGSLIDLYPDRADLRRFAGARLEHLASSKGLPLAVDTFRKAAEQRPDHPSSHRLLAFALAKRGEYAAALDAALAGANRSYPAGRFRGVERILREDAGLLGAALVRAEPGRRAEVESKLREVGATIDDEPSLRFVLNWETDANDVDFHIRDASGGHAFYSQPTLPNGGGELYADVTTGYGPECFTVRKPQGARSPSYTLQAHYYSRGPMGYGMGKLEIIDHDGKGGLRFDERPFVVMTDRAFVDLGKVGRP
ncbi:MAG TPA: VIT domain-containing protein [Polyangiaceae bacterium]|nr:VIT domain-containing protein [Polyangiaceae bacterium]